MSTRDIASLNLSPVAEKAAELLQAQFPDIEFTSGRRDLAAQAHAMAGNVVTTRDFIKRTYAVNDASEACQRWVDDHPEATDQAAITAGLLATLQQLGAKAGEISRHLTGDAFDVQPVTENAAAIKAAMGNLPGKRWFTPVEAGLPRWHVEF